jgi:hypothetical protein
LAARKRRQFREEDNMKQPAKIAVAALALAALGACVAGSPESQHAAAGGLVSQLVLGFWHGLIAPVTLIIEIINRLAPNLLPWSVRLYEAKNASVPYDVGFYLGLAGGPSVVWTRWRRRGA